MLSSSGGDYIENPGLWILSETGFFANYRSV